MLQRHDGFAAALTGLCILVSCPACLTDPEEARYPTPEAAPEPEPARVPKAEPAVAKTCAGATRRAADGLIDDMEDGDGRAAALGGRTGYWWVAKADRAVVTTPASGFAVSDGGAQGSKKAVRFAGKTDPQDPWGAAVGVNFLESGSFYDASRFAGIAFKIRASTANLNVRVKLPDVNTHPDGGVCKTGCWNAFGKELLVGPEWQDVVVTWAELGQQPDWGAPRPPAISAGKLKDIEWAVNQGVEFDIVVDDIHFVECG